MLRPFLDELAIIKFNFKLWVATFCPQIIAHRAPEVACKEKKTLSIADNMLQYRNQTSKTVFAILQQNILAQGA